LFPGLLFLYAASAMVSLSARTIVWPVLGSALVVYIFLVKPSLIYIAIIQLALLAWIAWRRRSIRAGAIAAAPFVLGLAWFLLFSPTSYFSEADQKSEALRVAVLSDEMTVSCIPDADSKTIVRAYIHSAYASPNVMPLWGDIHNDVQRY